MQIFYVQPEKLWSRYLLAAALIVILVVTSHVAGQMALSGSPEAAAAINISGRQRSLAYKIARLTHLEAQNHDHTIGQPVTESLDEALKLFKDSHYALYEGLGDSSMTVGGAAQRRRIYEQRVNGKSLDQRFSEFIDLIERTRRGDPDAFAELETLKTVDILFEHLDRAVHALEDQAANRTHRASLISDLSLTAAFIVLVLEALFIFWPAQRTVTQSIRDLKKSNEALSQSKRELQSALGDADIARSHVEHLLEMRTTEAWQAATEISMPLASIDASLRSIRSEGLTPEEARELMDSRSAVRRIRRILEEGFDRRRDETRLEAANTASTNIRLFADALGNMAEVWTRGRPVKIRTECADIVPEHLMLDCPSIERVLSNLLSNAVKFTDEGEVVLSVTMQGRDLLAFEVTDTGCGIPSDIVSHLFANYNGQSQSHRESMTGTGLGLAICRELAEAMGGTIRVESTVGVGTTFTLILPTREAPVDAGEPLRGAA